MSRFNRVSESVVAPTFQEVAPLAPRPVVLVESVNPIQRIGFVLLLVYLFAVASLLSETSIHAFGFKPYVTMIFGPLALACVLASGGTRRTVGAAPGIWLIAFALWLVAVTPFSEWRSGSLALVGVYYLKNLPTYFLVAALVVSLQDFRRFAYMLAASAVAILFIALAYGDDTGGRFAIDFGSFKNPNDFSTHLVVLLPFVLFVGLNTRSLFPVRVLVGLLIAAIVFTIVQTGSRSGAIGLAAVVGMIVLKARPAQRVVFAVLFAIAAIGAFAILQSTLVQRFETIFSSPSAQQSKSVHSDGTIGSNVGRLYLLRRSVELTAANPVFGVGPGQFVVAESGVAEKEGGHGIWLGTHNSYTEVSSETGLFGLILFAGALGACMRATNRVYQKARTRPECAQLSNLAYCLLASLSGFAVNILFCHMAYTYYLPMLTGMTVSLVLLARREIRA